MLYCIVDDNHKPIYVGRTKRPDSRLIEHTKRFGSQIQMLDLDDDDDSNEQEWIHYFRFVGADLENQCFKHSSVLNYERKPKLEGYEVVAFKMPTEKKEALQTLADKLGLNLSNFLRMVIYERLEREQ